MPGKLILKPISKIFFASQIGEPRITAWIAGMIIRRKWTIVSFKSKLAAQAAKQLSLDFAKAFFQIGPAGWILLKNCTEEINFFFNLFRPGAIDQPGAIGIELGGK